jgi:hypothetical protein
LAGRQNAELSAVITKALRSAAPVSSGVCADGEPPSGQDNPERFPIPSGNRMVKIVATPAETLISLSPCLSFPRRLQRKRGDAAK